ncbi:hypothetical protein MICAE_1430009 [Microcystis aeruginosa PCC 9806]|jgi:uncharacterized membrane protein YvbJ|uniref:Zinc ribbon domain-containing protein n=2 Tax=Microcystis TaxID=1125 RepID=A0A552LIE5_9CHRO|nr:zinc ribbon domain-containing protein [Microcystis aeruginosa]TRV19972.1 MAG: zinc ribbon domain-containing protein [Microcystis flos-aquae Mf_WU_F_19750830_S460]CCI12583.1 hypothetical protein MICAE_1430009 [Microcystis aeruginosa PCC 9806]
MTIIFCEDCKNPISDKAKQCPHCGCPVTQGNKFISSVLNVALKKIEEKAEKANKQSSIQTVFESVLGIIFLLFVFSSCVYRLGYPYTCEQAKQQLAEAESKLSQRFKESERISDLVDITNSPEMLDKIDSKRSVYKKCYK